jgi:peptide/nickel transport system substrate-binding protein
MRWAPIIETIFLNLSDPNTEVGGERSSIKTKNPLLSDPAVRRALSMLVNRDAIQKIIYGRAGRTTGRRETKKQAVR